jgi:hypothetical protein
MTSSKFSSLRSGTVMLISCGFLIAIGCGDDSGLAKRYSVKGTVTYKNQPIQKGRIDFLPTSKDGRAASGDITDGSYFLTTSVNGDGAIPGKYKVTVSAIEVDLPPEAKTSQGGGQAFAQSKARGEVMKKAKLLVPKKYGSETTTDLGAEVEAKSNKFDFDLVD